MSNQKLDELFIKIGRLISNCLALGPAPSSRRPYSTRARRLGHAAAAPR